MTSPRKTLLPFGWTLPVSHLQLAVLLLLLESTYFLYVVPSLQAAILPAAAAIGVVLMDPDEFGVP